MSSPTLHATGALPRLITPDLLWTGGCLEVMYGGEPVHGHFSTFLLKGTEKTLLIDSGHPVNWDTIEGHIDDFLEGRPLDYLFLTHAEFPHAGLLPQWMEKFPNLIALGDMRDYDLYYPEYVDRILDVKPGQIVELGDKRVMFIPAVWRDLPSTLWCYEMTERHLFVSDAFAFLHYHKLGQCDLKTSEQPLPDVKLIQFFNERALQWTRFTDVSKSFGEIDYLIDAMKPRLIIGAHCGVVDTLDAMIPAIKSGMTSGTSGASAQITKSVA